MKVKLTIIALIAALVYETATTLYWMDAYYSRRPFYIKLVP